MTLTEETAEDAALMSGWLRLPGALRPTAFSRISYVP